MLKAALPLFAMVLTAPAFAGGYVAPTAPPPVIAPLPAPVTGVDWTGFYGGVQLDALAGSAEDGASAAELTGHQIGVFAGYRYDFGNVVLGGEVDYMIGSAEEEVTSGPFTGLTFDVDIDRLVRAGVELGYDLDEMLAYVSVGYVDLEFSGLGTTLSGDGAYIGVGIDYLLSDTVILGLETNYHRFEDFGNAAGNDFDILTIGLNVAYRF